MTRMDMERIDENLIKVFISNKDLEMRGISFMDLLTGKEHIEEFFYSILEEVEADIHFKDSETVTFQVLPKKTGIELFISRNDFGDVAQWRSELTTPLTEYFDSMSRQHTKKKDQDMDKENDVDESKVETYHEGTVPWELNQEKFVFEFLTFDDVCHVCFDIQRKCPLNGSLFYYEGLFYLDVHQSFKALTQEQRDILKYSFLEYGQMSQYSGDYLLEHAQLIREDDAIDFFAQNFN